MSTATFAPGGYRFIPAVFQYSGGVAAEPGFEIVRVRFHDAGAARRRLRAHRAGHPRGGPPAHRVLRLRAALASAVHRGRLSRVQRNLRRHAARNGASTTAAPIRSRAAMCVRRSTRRREPSFHAFCYTVAATGQLPTFVVAGSGEAVEGKGNYRDHTVRAGETSPDAIAREGDLRARRDGAAAGGARLCAGTTRPRRRSTPCTTCIRFWPTRSCGAAPRARGSPGTTRARRCAGSNTRWIAARVADERVIAARATGPSLMRGP